MDEVERRDDEALLNLQDKSNDELRGLLDELSAEEDELSYRRRVLHGRIDILRAELVRRLADEHAGRHDVISGMDIDRLIEILAGDLRAVRPPAPCHEEATDEEA
jgi:anti-sigma-K factor RsiG